MEHIKNISLGPRSVIRLGDLGPFHRLEAVCVRCRHRRVLRPDDLRRRWPDKARLTDLEVRLVCRQCGQRGGNALNTAILVRD